MKKIILMAAGLMTGTVLVNAQGKTAAAHESLAIGKEIPLAGREFPSVNQQVVSLGKAKTEKGLLVMFSCNTCPYVIKSQERTREMISYASKTGLGMVIVNSNAAQRDKDDSPEAMRTYARKQGYRVPYLADDKSELADAFGALRTPEVFLFNGDGKLVYKGAMEDNPSIPAESKQMFLKDAVDNMLAGKSIDPNSTKSVGCGIKRL